MPEPRKQLSISLTEPIAFLRSADPSGRLRPDPNDSPSLVRGLLTLNVTKPIRISNIQVELTGVMLVSWMEGVGSRRMELTEEQKVYSSTVTVFSADQVHHDRRTASVGPGPSIPYLNDVGRGVSRPRSPPRGRSEHRNAAGRPLSIDLSLEPPSRDTSNDNASLAPRGLDYRSANDLGPTPPYTPARSSITFQSRHGTHSESPAQTLEDLRQALRDNLDGQGHWHGYASAPSSARFPSTTFVPPPMGHSSTSSISSVSLLREHDGEHDGASPHLENDTLSRHSSLEEPPQSSLSPHRHISASRASRTRSPDNTHGTLPGTGENSRDPSHTRAGRAHSRFSLGAVLDAVKEVASRTRSRSRGFTGTEERERGRTRVRLAPGEEAGDIIPESTAGFGNIDQIGHGNTQHLFGLGRVLGLDKDHERDKEGESLSKELGEGWREFKPGTYTYPISFLLPPTLPPSFSLPNGSLNYTLKAVAHRPGAFTSKLSCQIPLVVVAAPAIGAGEGGGAGDPGPVTVEKQWEGKLAYVFGLSGRLFVLGSQRRLEAAAHERVHSDTESQVEARAEAAYGTAVLDLTMMPLEKIKIWRLTVSIDEHVSGVDRRGKIVREEEKRRITLLDLQDSCPAEESVDEEEPKQKNKQKKKESVQIPLLPTPISPHRSPLLQHLPPSADPSTLAGPGPYTISTTIGLPGCHDLLKGSKLHFSVKQRSSRVRVEHTLRLTMRVELAGDNDPNESEDVRKKRMFDVAVQTPITILSCRCVPEYQALPRYSQTVEDNARELSACPCELSNAGPPGESHEHDHSFDHVRSSASTSSLNLPSEIAIAPHDQEVDALGQTGRSRSTSRAHSHSHSRAPSSSGRNGHGRPPLGLHVHSNPHNQHVRSHSRSHSHSIVSPSYTHASSQTPVSTPHPSRPPSPFARYERLVSGLESEAGEAPPSYESVAANS